MENSPQTSGTSSAAPCFKTPFREPEISSGAKKWSVKIALIVIALVVLQIPLYMVKDLSRERGKNQQSAAAEIASGWGGSLCIRNVSSGSNAAESMSVKSNITSELRYRGIYQSVIYTSVNDIQLRFPAVDKRIEVMMSYFNGLQDVSAEVNGKKAECIIGDSVIIIPLPEQFSGAADCRIKLRVRGSQSFKIHCSAARNRVEISGNWEHPDFAGASTVLPDERRVGKDGFNAVWQVNNLVQPHNDTIVGVDMHIAAGTYQQVERTMTYATFFLIVFFFTLLAGELLSKTELHPLQYMVAAGAPVLFYLLLLAVAEKSSFLTGFIISAAVIVAMVTGYARMFFRRSVPALIMGAVFAASYAVNYFILQMEDFALLSGTIMLAVILGVLMLLTGRINVAPNQK